jgi:sec-independent protein translocase protein TatA
MAPTWFKLLLVILLIVVLFGRGRISDVMGDFAKGIKNFKKGLSDDDAKAEAPKPVEHNTTARLDSVPERREDARVG